MSTAINQPSTCDLPAYQASSTDAETLAGDLVEAARGLIRASSRAAGPGERQGLTGAQFDLLRHVGRHPDQPVADVAAALQLARNTVSTLVGQLCEAGLLERVPDPRDGRVVRLRLQPGADKRMADWRRRRTRAVVTALEQLGADEREVLAAAVPVLRAVGLRLDPNPGPSQPHQGRNTPTVGAS